jgi:hypothetical protein
MVANVNKAFTDLEQSKKLAEILPLDSADMCYIQNKPKIGFLQKEYEEFGDSILQDYFPCWSLAALLNILHNKAKVIPSLSGGCYKAGKYTSDWCLDYEFENGDYQRTFADNPVDACYNMIVRLQDLNLL